MDQRKEQVWDRDGGLTAVCTIVLVPEALAAPSTSHIEYVSPLSRLLLFNGSDVFPRTPLRMRIANVLPVLRERLQKEDYNS